MTDNPSHLGNYVTADNMASLASLRKMARNDCTGSVQVLYRLDAKQTSTSFEDLTSATKFKKLVDKFGPAKAIEPSAMTVAEWVEHRIKNSVCADCS